MSRLVIRDRHATGWVDRLAECDSDIVIVRYPSSHSAVPGQLALLSGWAVVNAGALLYFSGTASAISASGSAEPETCDVGPQEESDIESAITDIFASYRGHYDYNPLLDHRLVTAGYVDWAIRTSRDPDCLCVVAREDGEITHLSLSLLDGDTMETVLVGTRPQFRSRGLGPAVFRRAVLEASRRGVHSLLMPVHIANTTTQRLLENEGLRVLRAYETVHLIRTRDGSRPR